jgi:hypothetical protein
MGYYTVLILTRVKSAARRNAYKPLSVYFGESENKHDRHGTNNRGRAGR